MLAKLVVNSTRIAITFTIVSVIFFALLIGILIHQWFRDTEDRAAASAIAAAHAVKINTGWIVEVAEQALHRMDLALGPDLAPNRNDTLERIEDALEGLPPGAKAYIISPEGRTLYTTDPNIADTDIRDREYFTAPMAGADFFASHLMISRLDGSQIFAFSQPLLRQNRVAGVAVISFNADLLGDLLASLALYPGSTISIVRTDGMLVARFPPPDGPVDLKDHVLFTEHLPRAESGTYTNISPVDGIERTVGYVRVPDTDFIAVASVSMAETMSQFWGDVRSVLLIVMPIALALTIAAVGIVRLLQKDGRRQFELEKALETNTMMFKEIHHRVKNNLQSMQSLIRMQALPETVKKDIESRFAAMSAVHEHMYRHDAYAALDARSFIASIVEPLVEAYGSPVALEMDVAEMTLHHERATPIALLLTEVVTNALKYAFLDRTDGKVAVSLQPLDADKAILIVSDNGSGFRQDQTAQGMGSRIIQAMVMQLEGKSSYTVRDGVVFSAEIMVR